MQYVERSQVRSLVFELCFTSLGLTLAPVENFGMNCVKSHWLARVLVAPCSITHNPQGKQRQNACNLNVRIP